MCAAIFDGARFPRFLLANEASERLLVFLGVELVDDCDPDLEAAARAWLASIPVGKHSPATQHVRTALERIDQERRPAA